MMIRNSSALPLLATGGANWNRNDVVISAIQTGADPAVLNNTFNVQAYAIGAGWGTIPAETGPTQEPIADQGAVGDGVADDTAEVQAALAALPSTGGVLDLSQGIFGVSGTDDILQIGNKSNITIKGGGWSDGVAQTSGLKALTFTVTNRNDAVIRYTPSTPVGNNQNLVIRDLEIDVNNQEGGGINTQFDEGTWIISCYVHDVGNVTSGSPRGAIVGTNFNINARWIANLVRNTAFFAPSEAARGIWSGEGPGCNGCIMAHNIVTDTAHSGIIMHVEVGASVVTNVIEYNTVLRASTTVGGAAMKPEIDFQLGPDAGGFDNPVILSRWRRNYMNNEAAAFPGNGPHCIQLDSLNAEVQENLGEDSIRGISTFLTNRKNLIENNVFTKMVEYGIYIDTNPTSGDTTGLNLRNNTVSGDGEGMINGVIFLPSEYNLTRNPELFDFDDPIDVSDNLIVDATGADVVTSTDLDNYVNFTPSNNGPAAPGALFVLLPPSYV